MSNSRNSDQSGFTAIELLITLIVASIFLFAGYQLYVQVMKQGSDANQTARLSAAAYSRLRAAVSSNANSYPNGCTASSYTPTVEGPQPLTGLGNVTFTITVSCPYFGATGSVPKNVFLIRVDASTSSGRSVSHATFTN